MVFDDEFSTVPFMREGTIPPNWTDLVQCGSQSGAPENIEPNDTWLNPYIQEYPSKNPTHLPRVTPENNRNMIPSLQSVQQVKESPVSKGAFVSEVIECPVSEGVQNTPNLPKVRFYQQ